MSADWAFSVLAARATVVLVLAAAASVLLRHASAATRHASFTSAVLVLLALPWLSLALPTLDLPVLPAPPPPMRVSAGPSDPGAMDHDPDTAYANAPEVLDEPSTEPSTVDMATSVDPTPPALAFAPPRRLFLSRVLLIVWAAGALAGILQLAVSAFLVRRIARRAAPIEDIHWNRALADAATQLGLRRPVRLVTSPSVVVPVVWGYRHGVVMLPPEADAWPADRKRAFLLHELAHVARHDCLTQAFAHFARAVYWPHPLVWWAVRRLRAEAERACDDRVVTAGNPGAEYAHHLLEAARALKRAPRPVAVLAIAERSSLEDRLLALLDPGLRRGALTPRALAYGVVLSAVLAGSVAVLQPVARAVLLPALPSTVEESAPAEPPPAPARPAPPTEATGASAVHGVVADSDGKPIANAVVLVARPARRGSALIAASVPDMARTDAAGGFQVVPREAGPTYWVRVEADGRLPYTTTEATRGTALAVRLRRGNTVIEGTVRDAATRNPIADATVIAREVGVVFTPPLGAPEVGQIRTRTDAKGHYRFTVLGTGAYRLSAQSPTHWQFAPSDFQGPRTDVDLLLPRSGGVTGIVTRPDGHPVAAAVVRGEGEAPWSGGSPSVTTDDQGRYELPLARGRYRLLVLAAGHPPSSSAPLTVETGQLAHADVRLSRPFRVRGRLVQPPGKPVRGALRLVEMEGLRRVGGQVAEILSTVVGDDGRFEIASLPQGTLLFEASSPGLGTRRVDVRIGEKAIVDLGDIELERGAVIRGRVQDAAGSPIMDANVSAEAVATKKRRRIQAETDGTFAFGGLEPGLYEIRAEGYGFTEGTQKAETDKDPVVLRLAGNGGVIGRIVDESGKPVYPRALNASAVPPQERRKAFNYAPGPDAADGRFTVDDIDPGPYELTIHADGFVSATVRPVVIEAGRRTDAGTITMSRGRTVRGVVVDPRGQAVHGATVQVDDRGSRAWVDADGRFELAGVPLLKASLKASHPGYLPSEPAQIAEAAPAGDIRLVLGEGGRLVGRIRYRRPGPRFPITVQVGTLHHPSRPGYARTLAVGDDGTFQFDDIPGGRLDVMLRANEERDFHPTLAWQEAFVTEGKTTAVDFDVADVRVHGRVTRNGAPLAGAQIALSSTHVLARYLGPNVERGSLPERLRTVADKDGRYEMIVPVAGPYRVSLWAEPPATVPSALKQIDVPNADTFALDFEIVEATLRGRVLDAATGEPLAQVSVAGVKTDASGAFEARVEPGRRTVSARTTTHLPGEATFDVAAGGEAEATLRLQGGEKLSMRVTDELGQPVPSPQVWVASADGRNDRTTRGNTDGTAHVDGLAAAEHTVIAGSETHGFGLRRGVRPGGEPVTITVRAARHITLLLKDEQGRPVIGGYAFFLLRRLDGVPMNLGSALNKVPDTRGAVEASVPAGDVELEVITSYGQTMVHLDDAKDGSTAVVTLSARR